MITPESKSSTPPDQPDPDQPLTTLRGAGVDVDIRRVGQVVIGVCLVALLALGVILLVAGVQKNQQATSLRQHGVPVSITVTTCLGLMGGTGAQGAGYSCSGSYTLDGARYQQAIPGFAFHRVGSTIEGVAVPGDPKLLSTPGQVASQHASWRVFILPVSLLLVVVLCAGLLVRRGARRGPETVRRQGTAAPDPR